MDSEYHHKRNPGFNRSDVVMTSQCGVCGVCVYVCVCVVCIYVCGVCVCVVVVLCGGGGSGGADY